ncbi:MAG: carbon storage regulator CsrA [Oscillospiraceae bacterium]|jgi:carbon storage regulator|nr:carbon storage regulator CsrA [Oscillospiraceae bacterium]MBQ8728058.1 carbon storage regulator CsrA [Oscillospiraceae bacterium]MBR4092790.1 carbon storage regulator CsrA [Oscillospiraceae bacterium]MBR6695510.1 carbon storage regulator CsrA [Oscillospiraceae bacterium]
MLVVTRKTDEGIVIADNIVIKVLDVGKDRVKIGIEAPKDVRIVREELFNTEKQNVAAAEVLSKDVMEQLLKMKNTK